MSLTPFQTIEQLRELLPVYEQEIEESNYVPAWQRQMIYISRRFVDWLADEFIDDVQVEGCYLRECNMNLAARELYVQIYTPFPAQEQRSNLQGTHRERFRHPGEGLREMHHRPETDLKRPPG